MTYLFMDVPLFPLLKGAKLDLLIYGRPAFPMDVPLFPYDVMRNQIARNADVMLETNENLCDPLDKRDPNKTLFLLVTSRIFKDNPNSRLYGYKMNEYRIDSKSIQKDLQHRKDVEWDSLSEKLGWLTWEEFKEVNRNCCRWL